AVRAGHHCAHPLMDALNVKGTVRASFAIYNTLDDVERFIQAVEKAVDML
ncbi:MAG: aminotransferase class V-fold PLP-dependent enzyme, partial [Vibrionaceae bacterium]|nr:aminotransferase class V-fold PLP-dependent enzyme [Vibrionaceae bacterium]